jgi:hypothetical protein
MRRTLLIFTSAALNVLTAHAEQAVTPPGSSRGHAYPKSSRGEAFPDDGPRYRATTGHGHHTRRQAQERARPAERHRPAESIGRRAEPEYPAHLR